MSVMRLCAIKTNSSAIVQPSACKVPQEDFAALPTVSAVLQSSSTSSKSFLRLNSRAMFHKQHSFVIMISSYSFSISVPFCFSNNTHSILHLTWFCVALGELRSQFSFPSSSSEKSSQVDVLFRNSISIALAQTLLKSIEHQKKRIQVVLHWFDVG